MIAIVWRSSMLIEHWRTSSMPNSCCGSSEPAMRHRGTISAKARKLAEAI
jgi:hypothetical protein